MSQKRIQIKVSSSVLDRIGKVCAELGISRGAFLTQAIEHALVAMEQRSQPIPVPTPVTQFSTAQTPANPPVGASPAHTEAAKRDKPLVVTDEQGNRYTLIDARIDTQVATKRDPETELTESVDRAIGETLHDWQQAEDARDAQIAATRLAAENLPRDQAEDLLEAAEQAIDGGLHIHHYVQVAGTERVYNAEPYMGQTYATFVCSACRTEVVKQVD